MFASNLKNSLREPLRAYEYCTDKWCRCWWALKAFADRDYKLQFAVNYFLDIPTARRRFILGELVFLIANIKHLSMTITTAPSNPVLIQANHEPETIH